MWTFEITTGKWYDPAGAYVSTGYAGHGAGVDNPADEAIPDEGPIPEGTYQMGAWFNDLEPSPPDTAEHKGPIVCHLTPEPGTNDYGRSGFMIHGDSVVHPGQASLGCAIADHATRLAMSESPDQVLSVVKVFTP